MTDTGITKIKDANGNVYRVEDCLVFVVETVIGTTTGTMRFYFWEVTDD